MELTLNQKELLSVLLDKYERSKTYDGTNLVSQKFSTEPATIWPEYVSDFASVEQVKDFETEMCFLQNLGLITIQKKEGVITKLIVCNNRIADYYELLQRKRKKELIQEQIAFFEQWSEEKHPLIKSFCEDQLERIRIGKKPIYAMQVSEEILRILRFVLANSEELLERELSISTTSPITPDLIITIK